MKSKLKISIFLIVVLVLLFSLLIRNFVASAFVVNTDSMQPTLLKNEVVLASKITGTKAFGLKSGDIVLIQRQGAKSVAISRIVGVAGDRIETEAGQLVINGSQMNEQINTDLGVIDPTIVPKELYYVMNDFRANRSDSRSLGFIAADEIIGVTAWRLFSFDRTSNGPVMRWNRMFQEVR